MQAEYKFPQMLHLQDKWFISSYESKTFPWRYIIASVMKVFSDILPGEVPRRELYKVLYSTRWAAGQSILFIQLKQFKSLPFVTISAAVGEGQPKSRLPFVGNRSAQS